MNLEEFSHNLNQVQDEINLSMKKSKWSSDHVKLVVVTKNQTMESIRLALLNGVSDLGENYLQEALGKIESLNNFNVNWHMIGHLQRRKARLMGKGLFSLLHSMDSLKLAIMLERELAIQNQTLPTLLELNVSAETSKNGFPAWDNRSFDQSCLEFEQLLNFQHIQIRGLMTMPPITNVGEKSRRFFQKLKEYQLILQDRFPGNYWNELSMGTSIDFQVAIEEGATIVRIGQKLFGPRIYSFSV